MRDGDGESDGRMIGEIDEAVDDDDDDGRFIIITLELALDALLDRIADGVMGRDAGGDRS